MKFCGHFADHKSLSLCGFRYHFRMFRDICVYLHKVFGVFACFFETAQNKTSDEKIIIFFCITDTNACIQLTKNKAQLKKIREDMKIHHREHSRKIGFSRQPFEVLFYKFFFRVALDL